MKNYHNAPRQGECPVCCARDAHLLWETDSRQAAQHFVLKEKHPERFLELVAHIEALWGQNTCEIVQCDNCGFCHSHPYVAGDERFYRIAYDRPGGYPAWKWEFQLTYEELAKRGGPDQKLLEIGAGDGAFIKRISPDILAKDNILCTEFSEYGRHRIQALGVECSASDVRDLSEAGLENNFDFVCMFQVLEHMDRLDLLFSKLIWLIRKGGSLFIAVPNPARIQFNELNGALLDMPPNHIGRWNRKCFEEIGKQNGFHLQDFRIETPRMTSVARQFVVYRFLRAAQRSGSLQNRIEAIGNRGLLWTMRLAGVAVTSIAAIPALIKTDSGMGDSLWVHLIKA